MSEPNVTKTAKNTTTDPYKEVEFEVFLKEIGNVNLPNWSILAEALGVNRATITRWKLHPLAKQALNNALEENLRKMSITGELDWKMYREKLKMLGIKEKTTIEHENIDDIEDKLDLEVESENDVVEKIKEQVVEAQPSLQNKEQAG